MQTIALTLFFWTISATFKVWKYSNAEQTRLLLINKSIYKFNLQDKIDYWLIFRNILEFIGIFGNYLRLKIPSIIAHTNYRFISVITPYRWKWLGINILVLNKIFHVLCENWEFSMIFHDLLVVFVVFMTIPTIKVYGEK